MGAPEPVACFCYIVECSDGSFYTGWTTDPAKRVREHNAGRGARYTRARRPVELVLVEKQEDRRSAMQRERAIKSLPRAKKIGLIAGSRAARPHDPRAHNSRRKPRSVSKKGQMPQ